jgi:hypothetical protein
MAARASHSRRHWIHFGLKRIWNPYVRRDSEERTDEPSWCDTDESVRVAVEADRLADQRPVGVEHTLPERMRDDRHANGRPGSIIVGRKPATERDCDPKNREIVAAHELPGERFRLTVRIHRE